MIHAEPWRARPAILAGILGSLVSSVYLIAYGVVAGPPGPGEGQHPEEPSAAPAPAPSFTAAMPGDCVTWELPPSGTVEGFDTADCAGDHRFEITSREDLSAYPSSEFGDDAGLPSPQRQAELRNELCAPQTMRYLDGRFDPSGRYSVASILPPADSWAAGDRTMLCGLQSTNPAGEVLVTQGRVAEQDQSRVLEPGTCALANADDIRAVDCGADHQLEAVSVVDLAEKFPDAAPSTEEQNDFLGERCLADADGYLGEEGATNKGPLAPFWTVQSTDSWNTGSKKVNCYLTRASRAEDGAASFGVLRGAIREGYTIDGQPPEEVAKIPPAEGH